MIMEDESGRLALCGAALGAVTLLVTGTVVGVKGALNAAGELEVVDVCLPGLAAAAAAGGGGGCGGRAVAGDRLGPPPRPPDAADAADAAPRRMARRPSRRRGRPPPPEVRRPPGHRRQRDLEPCVVGGGLRRRRRGWRRPSEEDEHRRPRGARAVRPRGAAVPRTSIQEGPPCRPARPLPSAPLPPSRLPAQLDQFLTAVCATVPVDLMPGADDPCSFLLPQQPFHRCLLPQASQLETLNLCTNPYACTVGGADILGCSGQNVDDLLRYVDGNASRHGSLACSPLTSDADTHAAPAARRRTGWAPSSRPSTSSTSRPPRPTRSVAGRTRQPTRSLSASVRTSTLPPTSRHSTLASFADRTGRQRVRSSSRLRPHTDVRPRESRHPRLPARELRRLHLTCAEPRPRRFHLKRPFRYTRIRWE